MSDPAASDPAASATSDHCEAAKDLLLFMREREIRCDVLEVGINGVRLVGLVDEYAAKKREFLAKPEPAPASDRDLFEDE